MVKVLFHFNDITVENDLPEEKVEEFVQLIYTKKIHGHELHFYQPNGGSFKKDNEVLKSIEIKFE
ncbi:hypothetical protein [Brevibacillus agri]|uniref:hypothetical protein n=1 Tax=Brevibacillus agri TaxID=51101 RepID=UPI003D1BDD6F